MNKKGGAFFFGLGIALFVWIIGIMIIPYFQDSVDLFRTDMDCTNTSITDGAKVTCLYGDALMPFFIIFIVGVVLGIIGGLNR